MTSITIVKSQPEIVALIGSIQTKQGDYRNSVSSAVLSVVSHSMEHSETTLVTKLLNTMFADAYRDLKVVATFINSVTPIMLEEVKEGRRTKFVVKACQFMENNYEKSGKSQKEINDAKKKANDQHGRRALAFEEFSKEDGEIRVRNLEWKETDPKEEKTVGFKCHRNVFTWFEEIEYVRKAVQAEKDSDLDPFKLLAKDAYENIESPIASAIKALKALEGDAVTDQVKADLETLEGIFNRVSVHVKEQAAKREVAVEVKTLEKAGATKQQVGKWLVLRADRLAGGTEKEALQTEFKQTVERIKENVAKKAAKAESDKAAA